MKNAAVRDMLGEQMKVLLERSRQDIPLIALDGLSNRMAAIGKVLLDSDTDEFVELLALRGMIGAAQDKVAELMVLLGEKLNDEFRQAESDEFLHNVYDQLDELHALLSYREGK